MRALAAALALTVAVGVQTQQPLPYQRPDLPVDARVRDLLGRMTLEEKFWQLFMIPGDLDNPANDYSHGIFGLQIRGARPHANMPTASTPFSATSSRRRGSASHHSVRGSCSRPRVGRGHHVSGRDWLAASFDTALMHAVADAIAVEARGRGIRQALSPVINIADDVRWGRVEETYGEDPYLSSKMAATYVRALESGGVIATPKHFVANVGEGGRDSYPIEHGERMLMERYFPPFIAALDAGARSVMAAYNSVDGSPATQNRHLLTDVLKRDWKFTGFVISDASGTSGATVLHMTEASTATAAQHAFDAGLDVVFQSQYGQQRPYLDAFQRGLIPTDVIDAAVTRVLRAKFQLGLFDHPYADLAEAERRMPMHRGLSRTAAEKSIVLLKNDRDLLPLAKSVKSMAVIGVDADEARLGGYSGPGNDKVSILAGIRKAVPSASVRYVPGPGRTIREFDVIPASQLSSGSAAQPARGLRAEYFDNPYFQGTPQTRTDARMDFRWTLNSPGRGIPFDWYSVRWTGTLSIPAAGPTQIGVEGNDGYRLYLDDQLIIDNWIKRSYGTRTAPVAFPAGSTHAIRLEYFEPSGNARIKADLERRHRGHVEGAD
jgi:beta-glucosidase